MSRNLLRTILPLLIAMLLAPLAFAQEENPGDETTDEGTDRPIRHKIYKKDLARELDAIPEVSVSREIDTLPDDIEPDSVDPDVADTALIFTNLGRRTSWAMCVGFNKNGEAVGRTKTKIPPLGLRYVRASDISNGVDFVGQVQCKPVGKVVGSVVFVGPALTDLPVRNGTLGKSRILFPLVAHY
jgi:hypothetical protein